MEHPGYAAHQHGLDMSLGRLPARVGSPLRMLKSDQTHQPDTAGRPPDHGGRLRSAHRRTRTRPLGWLRPAHGDRLSWPRIIVLGVLLLVSLQAVFVLISLGAALVPTNRVQAELLASVRNDGLGKTDFSLGPTLR